MDTIELQQLESNLKELLIFLKEEPKITWKSWIEIPRVAGAPNFLKRSAFELGLECTLNIVKGFWWETIYFVITGDKSNVEEFKINYLKAVALYQRNL